MTCNFKSYKLRVHLHPSFAVFAILGHYQWLANKLAGTKPVHTLRYTYDNTGSRLDVKSIVYSQWGGSDTTYALNIHEDIMGSATAYTYQGGWNNGQWANKHEYDVWGFNTKAPTYNYDPMYRSTEPYYTGHPYDGSLNIYFAENRFYDAETGTWLSSDPIKDGLNWYTYCEGNPTTFIDILGLTPEEIGDYYSKLNKCGILERASAFVITKPVEQPALAILGQEHMSMFLKNKDGQWYFFSYESEIKFIKVEEEIFDSLDSMNSWIAKQYEDRVIKEYTSAVAIEGDFSKSFEMVYGLINLNSNVSNEDEFVIKVPFEENWYQYIVNRGLMLVDGYSEATNYSLIFNNCGHLAMQILESGMLTDSMSVEEYLEPYKVIHGVKGISSFPSESQDILRMAFNQAVSVFDENGDQ